MSSWKVWSSCNWQRGGNMLGMQSSLRNLWGIRHWLQHLYRRLCSLSWRKLLLCWDQLVFPILLLNVCSHPDCSVGRLPLLGYQHPSISFGNALPSWMWCLGSPWMALYTWWSSRKPPPLHHELSRPRPDQPWLHFRPLQADVGHSISIIHSAL